MDSAALLDEDVSVFLEDFIAHGSHHGLELGKGGEAVLLGSLYVLVCFLLPVHTEYLVNDRLRASTFMVMLYLATVGRHSRSHNVQVSVVCIVMGIDEPGLSGLGIPHFLQILVREIKQLLFRHFMAFAGNGYMELRFLNPAVLGTVELEKLHQLFGGRMFRGIQSTEVLHLQQGGHSFIDLVFVVTDCMEVCASGKYGCYHNLYICLLIHETWGCGPDRLKIPVACKTGYRLVYSSHPNTKYPFTFT